MNIIKSGLAGLLLAAVLPDVQAQTWPKTVGNLAACLQAAQARLAGAAVKLELKLEADKPVYEIEIAGNGRTMEFECDASTGQITETEQEVDSPEHPLFKPKANLSLDKARAIALKAQPGTIVETEFEIESDGSAVYEFDIRTADGAEVKLEVDAATGRLTESGQQELYQVGRE